MEKLNKVSFYLSVTCLILLFVLPQNNLITSATGIHKLNIILFFTILTLMLGVIGLSGVQGWRSMLRSFITIVATLFIMTFITVVMFFGKLLS
ncbi:hypothetical protein ACQCVB_09015 [Fictibacillus phosphorivorans]|uniref:hypothetical protein n=1 Tax=Fictibacillus phosphorivorans TaxID=1221500 RepID=UPI003CED0CB7